MEDELESRLLGSMLQNDTDLLRRAREENNQVWRIAVPSILFRLSAFGVLVVTQSYIGHIGQVDLAAYALVQTILVQLTTGVLIGMSSATETLCGQAFGAKQYHMLGIYLQRSWIVDNFATTLLVPFFVFATQIYKLLGQENVIADAAGGLSLWFIGVIYAFVFGFTSQMYLQAQRKNMFIALLSPVTFLLHWLLSWIFVSILSCGIPGAMIAMILSRWISAILILCYIFGGWCPDSWAGFSKEAFHDILPFVKLSVSSGVMFCVQLWSTSVLVLLAGYTSNATVNISAFSICLNINAWLNMVCLGFMIATCVRVSNEIGKGNIDAAKFSIKVALSVTGALGVLFSIICLAFSRNIPYLLTSDEEVAEAVTSLFGLLAITILLNSFQAILSGVAVGTGLQGKVAIVNIFSYYLIGVPIGCVLAYVAHYEIAGIWIGLLSGQITQVLVLGYLTWRIDWKDEVSKATQRLNRRYVDRNQEGNQLRRLETTS